MLNNILDSSKYVSDNSKYVSVNYEVLNEIISTSNFNDLKHWLNSYPFNVLDMTVDDLVVFLLVYHSICFSTWGNPKWKIDTDYGVLDGSFAIMYLLLNKYKKYGNYNMNFDEFCLLLKGNIEIPLLKERFNQIKIVINYLNNNSFYDNIKDKTIDIDLMNYIVSNFKFFKDERKYNNKIIPFYKRAQLLTSDILHIREIKENISVDYSNLIGCADYKIPQVMRNLGILKYNDELSNVVDNLLEIPVNSEMEVEIRANTLVVINYFYEKLNRKVPRIDINDYMWTLGQNKTKKITPYHRTRTINY